ncbi:DUF1588 domain-containing protein [Alkalimarinus sediminis]|uniref:DUF1588 domain-containing protein n=1 Tax=Alkalimarinus sediminis TaxID=1632866 RepID=A0A9E8HRQ9_9ALTE|nr:DUF1588 domain-containing protein [Alkalimarinus sediminis]UZW75266.1 DUF1588 domain-containing protein [Alkalimarinus sediminis]
MKGIASNVPKTINKTLLSWQQTIKLVVASFVLLGCGEYSGEEQSSSGMACATLSTASVQGTFSVEGQQLYSQQCASCHGGSGYGTASGTSLIGCATCGDIDTLTNRIATTMPIGGVESCGLDCSEKTAEYIMAAFNSGFNAQSTASSACSLEGVELESVSKTLYRTSLSLTGQLPSEKQLTEAESAGEAALSQAIDTYMTTDAFYDRLMEIFNDVLHQDKYLPGEDALNLLDSNDYPERRWHRDLGLNTSMAGHERELYDWLRNNTNDAVSQEALRLIAHVVKNGRPFTDILTADYALVNRYSAQAYGVQGQVAFSALDQPLDANYPEDPNDFREVRIPGIPHAGLLTSSMFLNRFPTTDTNLNRHRSRKVFEIFLDTDILAIQGNRPDEAIDLVSTTPTLDNPGCTGCHDVMDPVAASFQNWDERGRYRPSRLSSDGWPSDIQPRGFNGQVMPLSGNVDKSLQWLGKEIAKDPRFVKAMVKILYTGLTGDEPLAIPSESASSDEKSAYAAQRFHLGTIEKDFTDSNYNLKVAIKGILLSPYYRASAATGHSAGVVGSARLLTPEMLDRKIEAVLGYPWKYSWSSNTTHLSKEGGSFNQLYGGIDSDSVTKRIVQPNGLMSSTQHLIATEMTCNAATKDLFYSAAERRLFPLVTMDMAPMDENGLTDSASISAIKQNIAYLHWRLFGDRVDENSSEVNQTYDLFVDIWNRGQSLLEQDFYGNRGLRWGCSLRNHPETGDSLADELRITRDENYVIRSWMGVLTYMLSDYRFLYE